MIAGAGMAMTGDIRSYMQQWLQTATKGNVSVDFAWFQDRMELRCKSCHALFRIALPESPTDIAWEVQEFVRKHKEPYAGQHDKEDAKNPLDPIPMTADFKLNPKWQKGDIDASEAKANLLKQQMETYTHEQSVKDLDAKIDWLKKKAAEKAEIEAENDKKAKEQALKNFLTAMDLMNAAKEMHPLPTQSGSSVTTITHTPAPEPKKKSLKIVQGRRFR